MAHYGFKVIRDNDIRSTYDWYTEGEGGSNPEDPNTFVVIRHYLPPKKDYQIDDYLIGPFLEGCIPHELEDKYPGIAISIEDWPYFLKTMHDLYENNRNPIEPRQIYMEPENK